MANPLRTITKIQNRSQWDPIPPTIMVTYKDPQWEGDGVFTLMSIGDAETPDLLVGTLDLPLNSCYNTSIRGDFLHHDL